MKVFEELYFLLVIMWESDSERLKILQGPYGLACPTLLPLFLFSFPFPLCTPSPRCVPAAYTELNQEGKEGSSFPLGREVPSLVLQDLNEESDLYLIFPSFSWTGSWNSLWALGFLRGSTFYSACWKCRFCLMEGGSTDSTLSMS